jgi:proteasome component ECM29
MVNYLHLNAKNYNLTEQKIDDMRLMSIRSGPLMEAIERCLDLLDEATMKQLQPRLENAMKNAVGLPSKVGCSRILVSLSTRHNVLFKPYSDSFLRLIEKHALDRNDTVSSSYAAAAGYVARGASDKQILRLVDFAKKLYFESKDDRSQSVPRRRYVFISLTICLFPRICDDFGLRSCCTSLSPHLLAHEVVAAEQQ